MAEEAAVPGQKQLPVEAPKCPLPTLYDVNYPSDSKTVPQQLSFTGTSQYGAGGWEAEPREVWVVIRPMPSGSGTSSATTSRKLKLER